MAQPLTVSLEDVGRGDVARVGGKNASLGEMLRSLAGAGLRVPGGFATTADNVPTPIIAEQLELFQSGAAALAEVGARIRAAFFNAALPEPFKAQLALTTRAPNVE